MTSRNSKIGKLERKDLLVRMLMKGFKNNIIEHATLQSDSRIRNIRRELEAEGLLDNLHPDATSGAVRKLARIVGTRNKMIEATMILSYYINIVNDHEVLDYDALMDAHDVYMEAFTTTLGGQPQSAITINEAYVLVVQYRSQNDTISFRKCRDNKCRSFYLEVVDQRMRSGCPFCVSGGRPVAEDEVQQDFGCSHA